MSWRAHSSAGRASETGCVRVSRTESAPAGSRVRHFDERSESAQDAVAGLDGGIVVCKSTGLSAGEVIVFTDYYRVE